MIGQKKWSKLSGKNPLLCSDLKNLSWVVTISFTQGYPFWMDHHRSSETTSFHLHTGYRIFPITSCDREAQEAEKFHIQSGTYGLIQTYTEEPHKLLQMITWGLQYLLCGSRAGTNMEGWVTVIPTWKFFSPLVPPMWSNGNHKHWYGILSGGIPYCLISRGMGSCFPSPLLHSQTLCLSSVD